MTRDETRFSPNVGSLYSFVETSGWTVNATNCSYYVSGGITSNYNWSFTGYSQLQWWENGTWHDLASEKSGTYSGYGDKVYDSMYDYFNRQYVNRTVRVGNYAHAYVNGQSTSATAYIEYIVPALPPNATTVTATRNSNTSVTLSWTEASGVKESVRIERSIDGSSFAEIATVSGSATSYTDNTTAADHTYTYRIRYYNKNAYGGYSPTASVTMAPSTPTKITVARATSTNVNVTLTNPSSVATSIQWQVTYDGGSTWSSSTSVSGSPVTSFTASTNGGTVKIRVRNVNATGSSAWIVSDSVVTLVPPAPPTALEPSGIVNLKYGTLTFRWKHNPLDGSPQTSAILHLEFNGTISEHLISSASNEYSVDISGYYPGSTYSWKVKTKGADPSYSDWSSTLSGKLYAEPQIFFTTNNPPTTVTSLPIPLQLGYNDPQFKPCASAVMTVKRNGRTVYTEPLNIDGLIISGQITAAELLPLNGETYTVSVTARSGSTLEATTNTTFTVDYIEPTHGTVQVQNEPDTGYASLLATYDNHASDRSYTGNTNSGVEVDGAAIRSMTVDGKSVQDGTPTPSTPVPIQVVGGANLCDKSTFMSGYYDTNGYEVSSNARYGTFALIDVAQNTDYTFTIDSDVNISWVRKTYYTASGTYIDQKSSNITAAKKVTQTFTTPATTAKVGLSFDFGAGNAVAANMNNMMVNVGSTAMPYVPYGSLGLKVSGKNLADLSGISRTGQGLAFSADGSTVSITGSSSQDWVASNAIYLEAQPNTTYTFSLSDKPSDLFNGFYLSFWEVDASKANIVETLFATWATQHDVTEKTVTTTANTAYFKIVVGSRYSGTATGVSFNVQLEVGSTATDYTPYVDSLTEIPLAGHVLASLPDGTKDALTVDTSGHVTLTKRVERVLVDGSETWTAIKTNLYEMSLTNKTANGTSGSSSNQMCSHFRIANADGVTNPAAWVYTSGSSTKLRVGGSGLTSLGITDAASFKTWAASNPFVFYYKLATAQTVDLGYITMPELADGCTVEVLASLSTTLSMVSYDGLADAESISVIRVNKDGSRTQLADHAANYTAIVDKYAPLNTAYVYEVVTYAASGAYAVEVTPNLLESTRWFAYWGENNIAWAQWNPSGSYTLARPEKKRVHYAGRKWPVSYDSKAMDQEHSMTWTVVDMDDWRNGFIDLMNDGGRGVYKGCDGWVFHADFDYSATPQYTSITRMGDISLTISRIDGEQL